MIIATFNKYQLTISDNEYNNLIWVLLEYLKYSIKDTEELDTFTLKQLEQLIDNCVSNKKDEHKKKLNKIVDNYEKSYNQSGGGVCI